MHADMASVWQALTNPTITKTYFFNCEALSDWRVGSPIVFKMTSGGKEMVAVKGVITAIEPNRLLQYTCFSPQFENEPAKHTTVTYKLSADNEITRLSVTQGEFKDEETYRHTGASWDSVLDGLRKILEN